MTQQQYKNINKKSGTNNKKVGKKEGSWSKNLPTN